MVLKSLYFESLKLAVKLLALAEDFAVRPAL